MGSGLLLDLVDLLEHLGREVLPPTDDFHADLFALDHGINLELTQLPQDEFHEVIHLFLAAREVLGGKAVEGHDLDVETPAPVEELFEIVGSRAVTFVGVGQSLDPGKTPIAVDNQADVVRLGAALDLAPEEALVQAVKGQQDVQKAGLTTIEARIIPDSRRDATSKC